MEGHLNTLVQHETATHVFLHWEGFDEASQRAAGSIVRSSELVEVLVVVQKHHEVDPTSKLRTLGFGELKLEEKLTHNIRVSKPLIAHTT